MDIVFSRASDPNVLPFAHVMLAFLWNLAFVPGALEFVQVHVPWEKVALFLDTLRDYRAERPQRPELAQPANAVRRQLAEDFVLRGFIWSGPYYPNGFFTEAVVGEEERNVELPSTTIYRAERCLWLGIQLSSLDHWLHFDGRTRTFSVTDFGLDPTSAALDDTDSRSSTETLDQDTGDHV